MKTRDEIFNTPLSELDKNYKPINKESVLIWKRFNTFLVVVWLLVVLAFTLTSCTKEKCEDKERELFERTQSALQRCNNHLPCIQEVQRQADLELQRIYQECE